MRCRQRRIRSFALAIGGSPRRDTAGTNSPPRRRRLNSGGNPRLDASFGSGSTIYHAEPSRQRPGATGRTEDTTKRPGPRTSRFTLAEAGRSARPEFLWEFLSRKSGAGSFSLLFRRWGIPPSPFDFLFVRRAYAASQDQRGL